MGDITPAAKAADAAGVDRPIIFSASMVRGLIREVQHPGTGKTQTRRLDTSPLAKCQPGDRLWVRENIWQASSYPGTPPSGEPEPNAWCWGDLFHYAADGDPPNCANRYYGPAGLQGGAFAAPDPYASWILRPSIHMPRRASRLTLIVTDVRRQHLQEISEQDARAEGFEDSQLNDGFGPIDLGGGYTIESPGTYASASGMFLIFWQKLHPKWDGYSDPKVVALTYTVHYRNIDKLAALSRLPNHAG